MFEFIAHAKQKNKTLGSEEVSEEIVQEELDIEALLSKRVGQVRRRNVLMR